jgi:hypothetical protein
LCASALERAEYIKNILNASNLPAFPEVPNDDLVDENIRRDDEANAEPALLDHPMPSTSGNLSPIELRILATTSKINNLQLVPFLKADLKERFAFPIPYRSVYKDIKKLILKSCKEISTLFFSNKNF